MRSLLQPSPSALAVQRLTPWMCLAVLFGLYTLCPALGFAADGAGTTIIDDSLKDAEKATTGTLPIMKLVLLLVSIGLLIYGITGFFGEQGIKWGSRVIPGLAGGVVGLIVYMAVKNTT